MHFLLQWIPYYHNFPVKIFCPSGTMIRLLRTVWFSPCRITWIEQCNHSDILHVTKFGLIKGWNSQRLKHAHTWIIMVPRSSYYFLLWHLFAKKWVFIFNLELGQCIPNVINVAEPNTATKNNWVWIIKVPEFFYQIILIITIPTHERLCTTFNQISSLCV